MVFTAYCGIVYGDPQLWAELTCSWISQDACSLSRLSAGRFIPIFGPWTKQTGLEYNGSPYLKFKIAPPPKKKL